MQYRVIPVTPFQQNCTLLWCEQTRKGAIVDPGGDIDRILRAVAEAGVEVEQILLTHGHLDHVGGTVELARQLQVPVTGPHIEDKFWLDALDQQCQMFGFPHIDAFTPDRWLQDGETLRIGQVELQVLHTPGHTPGHVVLYCAAAQLALVGDVLFAGSIGRTDFPRGDHATLLASIRDKLWPLGDEVTFIPGHGPNSTFGRERQSNPYVAGA